MSASNFNLRNISSELMTQLKQEAKRLHMSVNALILQLIERGFGFTRETTLYHDLDSLADTWSSSEAKMFEKNIKSLEKIDKELWQ